jgi:hypothetical protein
MKGCWESKIKCLVPIYVFPERKLHGLVISKTDYNVLSPNFHIYVFVSDLYILGIGLPFLLQQNRQADPGNI